MGWKTSDRCDTELVLGALEFAIWSRDIRDGQLIHHSDRGSTCTVIRFEKRLAATILRFDYMDGWYNTQRIQKKLDW